MSSRLRRLPVVKVLVKGWRIWLAVVCAVGAARISFYYLVYEPFADRPGEHIGREYEPLRPLLAGHNRVGYLSDEPLDTDPLVARRFGAADMMYAHAQYALAPVILAHSDPTLPLQLANFKNADALDRVISSGEFAVIVRPTRTVALLQRR